MPVLASVERLPLGKDLAGALGRVTCDLDVAGARQIFLELVLQVLQSFCFLVCP